MVYNTRHIVIVNGYGCHLTYPNGKDTPLKTYLDRVVRFIDNIQSDDFLQIFFTGGLTQQASAPGVTEARLMAEYVERHPNRRRLFLMPFKEETSFTTFYNISRIAQWLGILSNLNQGLETSRKFESTKITIFCEATRSANVMMLARHFLLPFVQSIDDITVETVSWERADPFNQVKNLIYNRLAIKYPWLGLAEREQRKRMLRAKEI